MSRKYARGRNAVAECQRSGQKMRYRDLVEDGHVPGLLVHPDWWEPKHPQEIPVEIDDPIALYRPAPEISIEPGYGDPENLDGNQTPRDIYEAAEIVDVFERTGIEVFDPVTDTFNSVDPGPLWLNLNVGYARPVINNGAVTDTRDFLFGPGFRDWFDVIHSQALTSVDQYAMFEVKTHIQDDDNFIGCYLYISMEYGERTLEPNGYYFYVTPALGAGTVSGSWARYTDGSISFGTSASVPAPGGIIQGWRVRVERIGNTLYSYYDNGTGWQQWVAPWVDPTPRPQELYVGFGAENYDETDYFEFDGFWGGTFRTLNGTIGQTLTGGETRILFNEAQNMAEWNQWILITRDDNTIFASRIVDGFASMFGQGPIFYVDITTPFSGTATAGNAYTMREWT